jgi:hypothetical protein
MRHYDIDVSIVARNFNKPANYYNLLKYLEVRGITYEEVGLGNPRKGKCTFYYDESTYYYDYYVHYAYFKLTCPLGFEPGDLDLPERFLLTKKNVYDIDSDRYFQAKNQLIDFELTHLNNYKNVLEDTSMIGKCSFAEDDDIITSIEYLSQELQFDIRRTLLN